MTYVVILSAYFGLLALFGVLSRKNLGVPTLALAAGSVLAGLWTDSVTPLVAEFGLALVQPPLSSIVAIALTILPAFLVLIRSPKARTWAGSLASGLFFAACAVMLTYAAFERAVVLDGASRGFALQLATYAPTILTICLVAAILQILFRKKKAKIPDDVSGHRK